MSILDIFCDVDDFMILFDRWFKEHALTHKPSNRGCKATLSMSEVMTIIIWFHQSHYRDFKAFYTQYVQHLRAEFPQLVSYNRFVELMPGAPYSRCASICTVGEGIRPVWRLLIPLRLPCVTTSAFVGTRPLPRWPVGAKARWAGSMASNCIW